TAAETAHASIAPARARAKEPCAEELWRGALSWIGQPSGRTLPDPVRTWFPSGFDLESCPSLKLTRPARAMGLIENRNFVLRRFGEAVSATEDWRSGSAANAPRPDRRPAGRGASAAPPPRSR